MPYIPGERVEAQTEGLLRVVQPVTVELAKCRLLVALECTPAPGCLVLRTLPSPAGEPHVYGESQQDMEPVSSFSHHLSSSR